MMDNMILLVIIKEIIINLIGICYSIKEILIMYLNNDLFYDVILLLRLIVISKSAVCE